MGAIQNLFIRTKHWQIFLLFVGLFGLALAFISVFDPASDPTMMHDLPFLAVIEMFALAFAVWLWSLGTFIHSVVPLPLRLNSTFFPIAVLCPSLYTVLFIAVFQGMNPTLFALIFPLHLFAMFCVLYSWYFISKSLAMAERQRSASFPEYVGYVLCLWFFPFGIWFIQPRINRLYAETLHQQTA